MARDFDGIDDQTVHTLTTAQNNLTIWSVGGWFYFDSNAQYRRLCQKGNAYPNSDWNFEWDDGTGLVLQISGWTTDGVWSITKPATGAWTHILVTYDGGSTANSPVFYVNGVSQTVTLRNTPAGTLSNAQTNFYLGSDSGTGQYHDGRIAEFATWNRILTADEANSLGAKAMAPRFVLNGLVMYLPLLGRYSPEIELVGGANGTLTGTLNIPHPRVIYPSPAQMRRFTTASVATAVATNARRMLMGVGL